MSRNRAHRDSRIRPVRALLEFLLTEALPQGKRDSGSRLEAIHQL